MDWHRQKSLIMEWMKYGDVVKKMTSGHKADVHLLPGSVNHLICHSLLARIIGWGRYHWNSLRKQLQQNLTAPIHGAMGKWGGNSKHRTERNIMMHNFFDKIEALSSPRATQIVCVVAREGDNEELDIRDGGEDLTDLPSHMTKCGLYKNFVAEHGWKYYSSTRVKVSLTRMEGEQQVNVPSFWLVFYFWDKHYPKMVITKPHVDIRGD
eukprot:10044515-Ditylum_brightwellii.AAC.1